MFEGGRPPAVAFPAVAVYLLLFDFPLTGRRMGPDATLLALFYWRAEWLIKRLSFAYESIERSSSRSLEGLRPYFMEILSTSGACCKLLLLRAI